MQHNDSDVSLIAGAVAIVVFVMTMFLTHSITNESTMAYCEKLGKTRIEGKVYDCRLVTEK